MTEDDWKVVEVKRDQLVTTAAAIVAAATPPEPTVNPAAAPDRAIFDLVGHNIPVFFIPDAIKFPDLVHSVKMEPDRGYPQADSAHDTCCTFVSLIPESMHMIMWAMSDRATPRSFRLIEGFSVNTFRLVGNKGKPTFVNFHWRQKLGMQSVIWDEAVKINGPTPTFIVVICLRRSQAATIRMGIRRSVVR